MSPKSRLGQNFLRDENAIRRMVTALGDCSRRTVVEIGPGQGAVTRELAAKAGRLIALEVDRLLAFELSNSFANFSHVTIEHADVLGFDFEAASGAAGGRLVVIGNLPYYITSPILMKLAQSSDAFDRAVLMVQREVADRVTARPGSRDYGLLSLVVQLHGPVESLMTLPPGAFTPPPEVHSTVFRWRIEPRFVELGVPRGPFFAFLRCAFALKRKTLANNLRAISLAPEMISAALERADIAPRARAEELPAEALARLYRILESEGAIPKTGMAPKNG